MVDRLAVLLDRFSVSAQVFHAGALCGINTLEGEAGVGQLHLIRRGPLEVFHGDTSLQIDRPSLLLYPRAMSHRFVSDAEKGADMACANLRFEGGAQNPICAALPDVVCLPLDGIFGASDVLALLFEEAFTQRCGRTALVNRLFEVVMIQILRQLMETGEVKGGMLAGLSHPRLRNAIVAMHEAPSKDWTLDELARVAGMSRSVFATHFREALGITPGQYLQGWRVGLAQQALQRGKPLKVVASDVGYGSEAALSRAFKAHSGLSPREWKRQAGAAA
ncbi:AraC family transcriptional regulator [Pseudoxanthomonas sp. PXM03]|uniref:AraC family transcriptional regulator n=1 Tax=Pseudoxanthomonas sp. PXM03 TaxID=2769284 RepID=UPI001785BFA8|nr:AraC family transcriptional regulator [Pseudoxanthomonas sp. PXM03]MBD9436848.1 AraC family transcriptional regulator [Pseudoxanthomonas sp. PXM03]